MYIISEFSFKMRKSEEDGEVMVTEFILLFYQMQVVFYQIEVLVLFAFYLEHAVICIKRIPSISNT